MSSEYGVTPAPQPQRRGNLVLGLVLGVAVGLALLLGTWALLGGPSGSPSPSPTTSRTPTASASATRTPSVSPTPSRTPTPTPTPTVTEVPEGVLTQLESGTIFTVLESMSKADTTPEAALARAAELGAGKDRPAVVVDSDAVAPTLSGGYWAVGVPGAKDREESAKICDEYDREPGGTCYPRPVA